MRVPTASSDAETTKNDLLSTGRFSIVMDDGGESVGPADSSGLSNVDDVFDPDETRPAERPVRPEAPSDPEWGKSSYRPQLSSVARRASLFDLPDPSESENDPLAATDPNATRVRPTRRPVTDEAPAQEPEAVAAPEPISTIGSERALYRRWQRYQEANGISPSISLYELRHTFVSVSAAAMTDGQLKLLVGHSRNMDTQGIYGHEVEGRRAQLAQATTDAFALAHG